MRADLDAETEELQKQQIEVTGKKSTVGIRTRFRAIFHGLQIRLTKTSTTPVNPPIEETTDNEV